ncbi:MAG: hypothetical protein V1862_12825 [Methanobacteriota archaeon]
MRKLGYFAFIVVKSSGLIPAYVAPSSIVMDPLIQHGTGYKDLSFQRSGDLRSDEISAQGDQQDRQNFECRKAVFQFHKEIYITTRFLTSRK